MVTPCMTRTRKSHNSTAPNRMGTKLKLEALTVLRYFVMYPYRIMSIATQANKGNTHEKLPRIR